MTDPMSSELGGAIAAILLAALAYARSRGAGGFYDEQVYGMTPHTHRRYAIAGTGFALSFFAIAVWWPSSGATIYLFAAFVLFAVFYLTSYLRGAHEDDD